MIAKQYRFHGHATIRRLYRLGRVTRAKLLTLHSTHNPRRRDSRVAVVVSKKIFKGAPGRNRIRRRLYEIIRKNWSRIETSQDIVLTVKSPEVLVMTHHQLEQEVLTALDSAYLLVTDSPQYDRIEKE